MSKKATSIEDQIRMDERRLTLAAFNAANHPDRSVAQRELKIAAECYLISMRLSEEVAEGR